MSDDNKRTFLSKLFPRKDVSKDLTLRHVLQVSKKRSFPSIKQWKQLPTVLTKKEKRTLQGATAVVVLCLAFLGGWYVITHRTEIPSVGGEYTEALVGDVQFVNPLYASSDTDAALTKLVFSGLMRWDQTDGLVNDLAQSVEISDEGNIYTIRIRDDARFHNGEEIRARDVLFTINAIQNQTYLSQREVSFRGVTVTQIDDKTVSFFLEEPFAPFLSTLTIGILPASVWAEIAPIGARLASVNLQPVGSGPYKFAEFSKDKKGNLLSYTLVRNEQYYGEGPLIEKMTFKIYPDAEAALAALENKNVEGMSFVPPELEDEVNRIRSVRLVHPSILRETVLYFNQTVEPVLAKKEVREAIRLALDKEAIVQDVLGGNGTVIHSPILPGMIGFSGEVAGQIQDLAAAGALLDEAGYPLEEGKTYRTDAEADTSEEPSENEEAVLPDTDLSLTLTTVQNAEFVRAAERIAEQLAIVGIRVDIDVVDQENFLKGIVAERNYGMLLTGVLLSSDGDPFPFWHSSQTGANGLNLAGYANRQVDELLESARRTIDEAERAVLYMSFQETLAEDIPAIFLYQSTYAYAIASKIRGVEIERLTTPADRFEDSTSWFIKTKKVLRTSE